MNRKLDELCVNTIRTLAMDAVQQANSGHPGTPMALAPVVYCLWQRFLRFDPTHPIWPNRDRFVLSVGHASMLLYAMLHLTGVKAVNPKYETLGHLSVELEDIKRFRQLDSKCPGHPEYRWTSGVETTAGPMTFEFLPDKALKHAQQFIRNARSGFYDGSAFHRVIPRGIIQGGDPLLKDAKTPRARWGTGALGQLPDEFSDVKHLRGSVSTVRLPDKPNSGGAQFFICDSPQPTLDGQYSAFGKVTEGIDVVEQISLSPAAGPCSPATTRPTSSALRSSTAWEGIRSR